MPRSSDNIAELSRLLTPCHAWRARRLERRAAIISNLQILASWLLQTYTGERLVFELRNRLFWHAQRLSLAAHDRRGVNDIAYRIQHDAPAIQFIFIQGVLPDALTFAGMFYIVAHIDKSIAVVALVISPALSAQPGRAEQSLPLQDC